MNDVQETSEIINSGSERHIGPYRLLQVTGRGGTAAVYEAVDDRIGRTVAVKVLSTSSHQNGEGQDSLVGRMQREARAIARLSHPNVALILDVGTAEESPNETTHYIVMEFLRGETLRGRLDRAKQLSPEQAGHILEQSAAGLDAVHLAGVIHRDVKPSNLMLLPPDDFVKLMDFGVARFSDDTTVTRNGMMVGSPAYMAPELILGQTATPASDLWSLGVVLYEMLAGQQPFVGENIPAVLYQILHTTPAPIAGLSPEIQRVLTHALQRDPALRYNSAHELAKAFRDARTGTVPFVAAAAVVAPVRPAVAAAVPIAVAPLSPRPRKQAAFPFAAPAAALAVLGLGGAFLLVGSRAKNTRPAPVAATTTRTTQSVQTAQAKPTPATMPTITITPPRSEKARPAAPAPVQQFPPVAVATLSVPPPGPALRLKPSALALATPTPTAPMRVVEVRAKPTPKPKPTPPLVYAQIVPAAAAPAPPRRRTVRKPVQVAQVASDSLPAPVAAADAAPRSTPTPAAEEKPVPLGNESVETTAPPAHTPDAKSTKETAPDQRTIAGIWRGTHSRQSAILVINNPEADGTFTGTMNVRTSSGRVLIAVAGEMHDDGSITFAERRVIESAAPRAWDLGVNSGTIDPTTGSIDGSGHDARGHRYTFTFAR